MTMALSKPSPLLAALLLLLPLAFANAEPLDRVVAIVNDEWCWKASSSSAWSW